MEWLYYGSKWGILILSSYKAMSNIIVTPHSSPTFCNAKCTQGFSPAFGSTAVISGNWKHKNTFIYDMCRNYFFDRYFLMDSLEQVRYSHHASTYTDIIVVSEITWILMNLIIFPQNWTFHSGAYHIHKCDVDEHSSCQSEDPQTCRSNIARTNSNNHTN